MCIRDRGYAGLYEQEYAKYESMINHNPNDYETYRLWGWLLKKQAMHKDRPEADELYNQAYEKYEEALKIKPDDLLTYLSWRCV